MKITADTNVLVRAAVQDDREQAALAAKALQEATLVAVPLPVLCEFVWVLSRGYKKSIADIPIAILRDRAKAVFVGFLGAPSNHLRCGNTLQKVVVQRINRA